MLLIPGNGVRIANGKKHQKSYPQVDYQSILKIPRAGNQIYTKMADGWFY